MSKKKKLIVPKAASPKALKLAEQLLEIADGDLRSAQLLHAASCFPQAVFSLQQGVEKTGKAYGLAMGLAEPAELQKEWSHNTLKHSELFADYGEQQGLASPMAMAPEKIKAFISDLKNPEKVNAAALGFFVEHASGLIQEHKVYKNDPARRSQYVKDMMTSLVGAHADAADLAKGTALAEFLVDMLAEQSLIVPTMTLLGIATAPHAVIARYPDGGTSPLQRYGAESPVVRVLPKLCGVGREVATSVRAICALASRLETIMAMPDGRTSDAGDDNEE